MKQSGRVTSFIKSFYEHPKSVGQTYLQHFVFASSFSIKLFAASVASIIHAFVPALFETTTSRSIVELHAKMHKQVTND